MVVSWGLRFLLTLFDSLSLSKIKSHENFSVTMDFLIYYGIRILKSCWKQKISIPKSTLFYKHLMLTKMTYITKYLITSVYSWTTKICWKIDKSFRSKGPCLILTMWSLTKFWLILLPQKNEGAILKVVTRTILVTVPI